MDAKVLKEIMIKNLVRFFKMPFLACLGVLIMTALVFPTAGLTAKDVSRPIEMLLPFLGVITMVPVFLPEQDGAIHDSVVCRRVGMTTVYLFRLMIAFAFIVTSVVSFCGFLKINECDATAYVVWGGIASAFFMGSVGFAVAGISGNVINGLLASMLYYLCNYGWKDRLGVFFLFRMSAGIFDGKTWLFLIGVITVILTFAIMRAGKRK